MIPKKRIRLSAMQRVEVWRRWKAGESLHAIGRALGKNNVVIHLLLKRHGGIAPPIRRRSASSLTLAERVYFCDPQSPWQRGSNENTNGLLRQYLPKKADLSCYSQSDLDEIALRLNQRPRKTLGFETPADRLQASVASTP